MIDVSYLEKNGLQSDFKWDKSQGMRKVEWVQWKVKKKKDN